MYVDDIVRLGCCTRKLRAEPVPAFRIDRADVSAALAAPGVRAVFTGADLNHLVQELWYTGMGPQAPTTPLPPLALEEVRFAGDPVALVIAENRYLAEDAAELVEVDYTELPAVVDYEHAADTGELVFGEYPDNLVGRMKGGNRDAVQEALAGAHLVVEEDVFEQMYAAVPMETRGLVCEWTASTGDMTIWAATQGPNEVRSVCARVTGLPEHRIRVIMRDTGGGFGQKVVPGREEVAVMLAARLVPGPVKWIEDRRENLLAAGQARHELAHSTFGFAEDGTLLAASIDHVQDCGAYPFPWPVGTGSAVGMIFPGPYRIPAASFTHRSIFTNTAGRTAYRGPWAFESMAREVVLDVAARRLGLDPVELRRRNMLSADELPYSNGCGMPYANMSPRETFEHALEILDYDTFRAEQAAARAEGRYLGVGTCSYVEPTTPGVGYYGSEGATIRIDPTGKVCVYVAGGSTGNSLETTVVQLTADALGVPIDDVTTIQGDTALTPYGAGTGGSRSGAMLAGAVTATATVLRERLVGIAAHQLEAAPEDIDIVDGNAHVRGSADKAVTVAEIAAMAYYNPAMLPPGLNAGLEATERYTASMMPNWANATHVCTCEVDIATGTVKLLRFVVAEDCGPMINPDIVEGQIAGGTVQGIGGALLEELVYDEHGNPLATTFLDYLLPTASDVPTIEFGHVETMGSAPGGYKGVGEGGAIGAPPAVVNAVNDALAPFGVEILRLPVRPDTIVRMVREAQSD
ncbi:MAG: xanthine dehydrogenase family protein molybdopterin-binding subunit [Acidimicrobiia bacterium]